MLRHATTWFACLAVGLTTFVIDTDAEAGWRRAARRGYGYGGYYGGNYYGGGYGGGYGSGCCGTAQWAPAIQSGGCCGTAYAAPAMYQQTAWQSTGGACSVQPAGYQTTNGTYNQTSGYAPQGTYQSGHNPPPPPVESDSAPPRTFNQAPEPAPPQPENDDN
jgi:hypothetical protein